MDLDNNTVWLIGEISPIIPSENIPSTRDVMKKYFFNHFVLRNSIKTSVIETSKELLTVWKKLNETAISDKHVGPKIKRVIKKFDHLKRSKQRRTTIQINHEHEFIKLLDSRFDIAPKPNYHHNKPGSKPNIHYSPESNEDSDVNADSDFEADLEIESSIDMDFTTTLSEYQKSKLSIGTRPLNFVDKIMKSPDVFSTLDRIQLSSPKFTMLCASMARASDINLDECVISTSTVARRRATHRGLITTIIKDEFSSTVKSGLVVHWDGKKLKDSTNVDKNFRNKLVERIAVVVTGIETEKIVTVARAENGKGFVAADIVYENLEQWNVLQSIIASCTDTTMANTGHTNGSVVLFEELIEKNLLYFACRHHIFELVIGAIFTMFFGDTTAPSRTIFENFKRDWILVDQTKFEVNISLSQSNIMNFFIHDKYFFFAAVEY